MRASSEMSDTLDRVSTRDYLAGPEDVRPRELEWGVLRDAPSPAWDHQAVVLRVAVLLDHHVRRLQLGRVCIAPMDVVLDEARALIVQPDVLFVSKARTSIIRRQVWGAPDLVVEVSSPGTALRDRSTKVCWYGDHGVRECWLLDVRDRSVMVIDFTQDADGMLTRVEGSDTVRSRVLPGLSHSADDYFA